MPQFRKKPVVVEAERYNATDREALSFDFREALCKPPCDQGGFRYDNGRALAHIDTLEGPIQVSDGDWIIRGVAGEFYPCKPDIFEQTYEEA